MKTILTSRVILLIAALSAVFCIALWALRIDKLIIVLNGLFIGTSVAIAIAYWRLFWDALIDGNPFNRARQMTWSFFAAYLAILFGALGSIYTRSYDLPTQSTLMLAIGRYLAIVAAVGQVTAPDFGLGLFYGLDRKVLVGAILFGLVVAVILIWMQGTAALALTF